MDAGTQTVFIVDDDGAVRHSLALLVKSMSLRAETFESARAFLDQYDPARPGCLVLDIRMPLMSGLELQQVCLNLIRNAIDAMQPLAEEQRVLEVSSREAEGRVELVFDDRGGGVPEHVRAELFLPFFTTKESGMGMGLSISHSIVAAHGGTLRYSDNDKGGARFTVSLPAILE